MREVNFLIVIFDNLVTNERTVRYDSACAIILLIHILGSCDRAS